MSSQISDLFKRIKELEDQLQQTKDQHDTDYQNALDKLKEAERISGLARQKLGKELNLIDSNKFDF